MPCNYSKGKSMKNGTKNKKKPAAKKSKTTASVRSRKRMPKKSSKYA